MTERRHPTSNTLARKAARLGPILARVPRAAGRFLVYAGQRFLRDNGLSMASALAYTALLATVPLLAIGLAMLAAFPAFDEARRQLREWLFTNLVPAIGGQVDQWVEQFIGNAGRLTAIGVVGLGFTAIMLLLTIESSLNLIFRVERERRLSARLFIYWTILTLGPLLLGASFSLAGWLDTIGAWAEQHGVNDLERWVVVLPTVLASLAFAILYLAVPNRRVAILDALLGGVAAGLLFTGLRWGFTIYIGSGRTYETIYGALAVIPIFLAWTYFSWVVVLFGAEITAALPEWRHGRLDAPGALRANRRLALALDVLHLLHADSRRGTHGRTRQALLAKTAAAGDEMGVVLRLLESKRFVAQAEGGRYVMSRDAGHVTLYDLVTALDLRLAPPEGEIAIEPWRVELHDRLAAADTAERQCLGRSLRDLFETDVRPSAPQL